MWLSSVLRHCAIIWVLNQCAFNIKECDYIHMFCMGLKGSILWHVLAFWVISISDLAWCRYIISLYLLLWQMFIKWSVVGAHVELVVVIHLPYTIKGDHLQVLPFIMANPLALIKDNQTRDHLHLLLVLPFIMGNHHWPYKIKDNQTRDHLHLLLVLPFIMGNHHWPYKIKDNQTRDHLHLLLVLPFIMANHHWPYKIKDNQTRDHLHLLSVLPFIMGNHHWTYV